MSPFRDGPASGRSVMKRWAWAGFLSGLGIGIVGGVLIDVIIQLSPGYGGYSTNVVALSIFSLVVGAGVGGVLGLIIGLINGLVLGALSRTALVNGKLPARRARLSIISGATTAFAGFGLLFLLFRGNWPYVLLPSAAGTAMAAFLGTRLPPAR